MSSHAAKLPQCIWYDYDELEIKFPPSWEVTVCRMNGHSQKPLSKKGFHEVFTKPVGTRPIREMARGKSEIVIVFDDMSRPTHIAQIIPYLLKELGMAGITDNNIRFIAALGTHGAHNRIDFVKKLGEEIVNRFPIYNHNPYDNCTFLGNTSRGTPVAINSEFINCDFKIGIGCILPHPLTGFGGGGKIVFPGIASVDSIIAHHGNLVARAMAEKGGFQLWLGQFEDNVIRLDIAEATRMAGLDIKIDAVINGKGQTTALFVGKPDDVHIEGCKLAREVYATPPVEDQDIAILNTYAKASEAFVLPFSSRLLKESGGDLILIANAPEGQVTHYLAGSFGKLMGGKLWYPRTTLPLNLRRLFVLTKFIDRAGVGGMLPPEAIIWAKTWPEVLDKLKQTHGEKAKVAVIPDATMQYFVG